MTDRDSFQVVELGVTTKDIITKFDNMCAEFKNFAVALKSLLLRRTQRTSRYQFQPLEPKFIVSWNMKISNSSSIEVKDALNELDEYVRLHRLQDRASGIEDLLCGELDEIAQSSLISMDTTSNLEQETIDENNENFSANDIHDEESHSADAQDLVIFIEGGTELKCSFCQETFFSKQTLNTHMHELHAIVSLQCLLCEEEFETKYKLDVHYRKKHKKNAIVTCPLCSACHYSKQSLQKHCRHVHLKYLNIDKKGTMKISEGELTKCEKCDYFALRKGRLWTHLEKEHGIIHEMYCGTCGRRFASYRLLQHHITQVHTLVNASCDICGKNCKNRAALNRHRAMHSQTFNCQHCDKVFRDRRSHHVHEKRHTSSDVFQCSHCDRSFKQKTNMTRHVKVMHLKEGKLRCNLCSFTTFYQDSLNDHVNRVHLGLKNANFMCKLCNKYFPKRVNYEEHMDKHEGRYRYSCGKCGKKYRNNGRCKIHFQKCLEEPPAVAGDIPDGSVIFDKDPPKNCSPTKDFESPQMVNEEDLNRIWTNVE